jgi:hypothetical protein
MEEVEFQDFSIISIKLKNFQGLEYFDDDADFGIVAKHMSSEIESDAEEKLFKTSVRDLEISFIFSSDSNEIFHLFSNPISLTLTRHEDGATKEIAYSSLDLLPLFSAQAEEITLASKFVNFSSNWIFRKITFDAWISTDRGLLQAPYENYLLFTIDSIYNLNCDEHDSLMKIGMKVPFDDGVRNVLKNFT